MRLRTLVIVLALTALLIGYYWVHKPFDLGLAQTLAGIGLDLVPVTLLAVCAGNFGRWLLNRFGFVLESRAERLAIETLIGLGLSANLVLIAGLLGGFKAVILWPLLVIVGMAALVATRGGWLTDCWTLIRQAFRPGTPWTRLLSLFVVIMLGTGLLVALTPPIAWDALAYHLVGPARYIAAGRIAVQPDNPYLGFPQGVEMLYGLALSLFGRDTSAAPLHVLFGVLALCAVAGLVRRHISTKNDSIVWLVVAILLSAFSVWLLFGWPYVDLAMMAYGAALLVTLGYWRATRREGWLLLSGIFLGLALGVKLTAVGLLAAATVYVTIAMFRNGPHAIFRATLILGGATILAFAPWLLKGALLYHNPIYPYLFGGVSWDPGRALRFSQVNNVGSGLLGSGRAWQWPLLPLSATIFGTVEHDFDFTPGPWLLTLMFLLPLSWQSLRSDKRIQKLALDSAILGASLLVIWWLSSSVTNIGIQTRFMTMAMPIWAVLGALAIYGIQRWPMKPLNVYFVFQALFVLSLIFDTVDVVRFFVQSETVPYTLGIIDRNTFLNDNMQSYMDALHHLADLPPGSQVRTLWEPRGYYCPSVVNCEVDYMFDYWQEGLDKGESPDEIFARWQHNRDAYFLIFNDAFNYESRISQVIAQFAAVRSRWLSPIWSNGGYTLYTWKEF
ncbi:MAG: ArnT family glycosyltransferase [Aggregatilineales bacterium]